MSHIVPVLKLTFSTCTEGTDLEEVATGSDLCSADELHTSTVTTPTIDHLQMYSYELTESELFINEIEIVVKCCTY